MSRSIALAATALWLLAGAPAPIAATVPSDGRIDAQAKNALEDEPALDDSVHVTAVQDGVVFLGSGAATVADQLRAIAAVSRVPGVREVRMRVNGGDEPREDQLTRVAVADRPEMSPNDHAVRDDASSEDELGHPEAIRITPEMTAAAQQASLAMARGVRRFVRNIRDGLITAEWRVTENNRRARYYRITRSGLRRLETEREEWERSVRAVDLIMRTT